MRLFVSLSFLCLEFLNSNEQNIERRLDITKGKMEFDLEDPLVSLEEEQPFTVSELFASESDHMPSPNYLSLTHFHVFCFEAISLILQVKLCLCNRFISPSFVSHLLHFVMFLQVQLSYKLDPFVAYLAINYMHRFMSSQEIPVSRYLMMPMLSLCSIHS